MVIYETMTKNNGYVNILDDDGYITIQMDQEITLKIFDAFDSYVKNNNEKIFSFGFNNEILELSLKFNGNYFSLDGKLWDDIRNESHNFQYFKLYDCDIEIWDDMYEFLKQK